MKPDRRRIGKGAALLAAVAGAAALSTTPEIRRPWAGRIKLPGRLPIQWVPLWDTPAVRRSPTPEDSETASLRDAPAEIPAKAPPQFDPMALDMPPADNSWYAVEAVRAGKVKVSAFQGEAPGMVRRIDPKTGKPLEARTSASAPAAIRRGVPAGEEERFATPQSARPPAPARPSEAPVSAIAKKQRPRATEPASAAKSGRPTARVSSSRAETPQEKTPKAEKPKTAKKESRPVKFRPVLLSHLLGKDAIRPPKGDIKIPDFRKLEDETPVRTEEGEAVKPDPPSPSEIESFSPPDPKKIEEGRNTRGRFHWHEEDDLQYFHGGQAWGRWDGKTWSWIQKSGAHWFVEAQSEEKPTVLLWNAGHWWWKANGVWFLLHQGEAWGYRYFSELKSEGLVNPRTGAQMVYSADGSKVAVITPGMGAALFDAESGQEVKTWSEDEMPKREKPKVPAALSFHPD